MGLFEVQHDWEQDVLEEPHSAFWATCSVGPIDGLISVVPPPATASSPSPSSAQPHPLLVSDQFSVSYNPTQRSLTLSTSLVPAATATFVHSLWRCAPFLDLAVADPFTTRTRPPPVLCASLPPSPTSISAVPTECVVGGRDGVVRLVPLISTQPSGSFKSLVGHCGDINTAKYFPSGKVVLTGSSDTMLKVWDSEDTLLCAATLIGHRRAVLSADFIDRGRHVVSGSADGTARLWDLPSQSCLRVLTPALSPSCAVSSVHVCGTALALAASDAGAIYQMDLTAQSAATTTLKVPMGACTAVSSALSSSSSLLIVGGDESGTLCVWDARSASAPLHSVKLGESSVSCIVAGPRPASFWVSLCCGSVYLLSLDDPNPHQQHQHQLTGVPQGEPVYTLSSNGSQVLTASRDGFIRLY